MTFSFRLAPLALGFAVAAMALSVTGCGDKHIGRPCDLGSGDDGGTPPLGGMTSTINPSALECPSRVCILPGNGTGADVQPLCTTECSSDDDCSDGERGGSTSRLCTTGFACLIATTVGELCCKSFCVCKDFYLSLDMARQKPTACLPGNNSSCKNVQ